MAKSARGRIDRLTVRPDFTTVRLMDIPAELTPRLGSWELRMSHQNYSAMYSVLLAAAVNGFPIALFAEEEVTPDSVATIEIIRVDWGTGED
jgi:hypothetical protein